LKSILSFNRVRKSFGNVVALDSISFEVPENKIIGLIGANGAGKTTALRHIIRYLRPDTGSILFKEKDIYSLPDTDFPVTYIPDTPVFFDELSVMEHLSFISAMYGTEKEVEPLIDLLELKKHLDKVPFKLSKGTKQKLMVACAVLRQFELLVADEPFQGLDPVQINVLRQMLIDQKEKGKTVLVSTHLLSMVESMCDSYIMIDEGRLLAEGSLKDIVSQHNIVASLEELYLYLANSNQDYPDGASFTGDGGDDEE